MITLDKKLLTDEILIKVFKYYKIPNHKYFEEYPAFYEYLRAAFKSAKNFYKMIFILNLIKIYYDYKKSSDVKKILKNYFKNISFSLLFFILYRTFLKMALNKFYEDKKLKNVILPYSILLLLSALSGNIESSSRIIELASFLSPHIFRSLYKFVEYYLNIRVNNIFTKKFIFALYFAIFTYLYKFTSIFPKKQKLFIKLLLGNI